METKLTPNSTPITTQSDLQAYQKFHKIIGRYFRSNLIYGFFILRENFKDALAWFRTNSDDPEDEDVWLQIDYMANLLKLENLSMIIEDYKKRIYNFMEHFENEWKSELKKLNLQQLPSISENHPTAGFKSDINTLFAEPLEQAEAFNAIIKEAGELIKGIEEATEDEDDDKVEDIMDDLCGTFNISLIPQWDKFLTAIAKTGDHILWLVDNLANKRYAVDSAFLKTNPSRGYGEIVNKINKDLEGFLQKNEEGVEITVNEMFERVEREQPLK